MQNGAPRGSLQALMRLEAVLIKYEEKMIENPPWNIGGYTPRGVAKK